MPYGLTLGYGQSYEQAELFRRLASKGEIWSYPQDHIFFRSRMSAMPNHSKAPTSQRSSDLTRNVSSSSSPSKGSSCHRGRDGALEKIIQMPVDILYEVGRFFLRLNVRVGSGRLVGPFRMCSCASEFRLRDLSVLDILPPSPSGFAQSFENNAEFTENSPAASCPWGMAELYRKYPRIACLSP